MFSLIPGPAGHEHGTCVSESRVLVSAGAIASWPAIAGVIAASGATPDELSGLQDLPDLACSQHCNIAVIATGQALPDGCSRLDLVRLLHQQGFTVIGYENGVNRWPLARRCKLLLTGCDVLLDSEVDGFLAELRRTLEQTLEAAARKWAHEQQLQQQMAAHGIVGESQAMLAVFRCLHRISVISDLPTLITGETGTGKELLARAIHAMDGKRRAGPFVALNCGAITPTLVESELFGHRRGAFTGADRDRKGLFRAAHGGVLFLDEIAELGSHMEAKLLRVLQDNRVMAVGDEHAAPVNVRVIAATNAKIREMVEQRTFRADLFHRLNVLSIHIPPVRERRADIPPLVKHFARKWRALNAAASSSICPEFVEALGRLELPGNGRQIENLVRWALVHNDGTRPLGLADLPPDVWQELTEERVGQSSGSTGSVAPTELASALRSPVPLFASLAAPNRPGAAHSNGPPAAPNVSMDLLEANGWSLSRTLHACERSFLQAALSASRGNQTQTARLLGITPRSVYNKLRRHHLCFCCWWKPEDS